MRVAHRREQLAAKSSRAQALEDELYSLAGSLARERARCAALEGDRTRLGADVEAVHARLIACQLDLAAAEVQTRLLLVAACACVLRTAAVGPTVDLPGAGSASACLHAWQSIMPTHGFCQSCRRIPLHALARQSQQRWR